MPVPEVVAIGLAGFLAWLFAVSAFHKLRNAASFSELAAQYLPESFRGWWRDWLVYPIGVAELAIALALLLPQGRVVGAAAAAALLVGYGLLMAAQLVQGRRDLRCGCAGPASEVRVSPALVARNLLTAALAVPLLLPVTPMGISPGAIALALGMTGFLLALYLSAEQLIGNSQLMARSR